MFLMRHDTSTPRAARAVGLKSGPAPVEIRFGRALTACFTVAEARKLRAELVQAIDRASSQKRNTASRR